MGQVLQGCRLDYCVVSVLPPQYNWIMCMNTGMLEDMNGTCVKKLCNRKLPIGLSLYHCDKHNRK